MVNDRGAFAIGETPIALRFFKKPRRRVRCDETFTAHRAGTEPLSQQSNPTPKPNPQNVAETSQHSAQETSRGVNWLPEDGPALGGRR